MDEAMPSGAKRVVETGLAVVHTDEIVYPAAGSEAQAELAVEDRQADVVIYFPVEVEVRMGEADHAAMRRVAEDVFHDLARALAARV
jgi:hypothetical protein